MEQNGSAPEAIEMIGQFGGEDTGKHFIMINNIDYNESQERRRCSARGKYTTTHGPVYGTYDPSDALARLTPCDDGAGCVSSMDVIGVEGVDVWDMGGLVRYRSRRDFLEIVTDPVFSGKHHFKAAALEKTIAFPVEPDFNLGDPRLILGLLLLAFAALSDLIRLSRKQ